jgi:superfamily II DNA/RNA helicase
VSVPGFERLGLTATDFQAAAVETLVTRGRDLMAVAATSSGKTEIYLASAIALAPKITVVASPLIALIRDQVRRCERYDIPCVAIHSHLRTSERNAALRSIVDGTTTVLVTTPETLKAKGSRELREALAARGVGLLAIDEGHVYEEWADSFRPAYRWLGLTAQWIGAERIAVLSATLTADAAFSAAQSLRRFDWEVLGEAKPRANLYFAVNDDWANQIKHLAAIWSGSSQPLRGADLAGKKAIHYGRTIKFVVKAAGAFNESVEGCSALIYHAELPKKKRSEAEHEFIRGETPRLLVATTAFGMGVDVSDIRMVSHGQLPPSAIDYLQEAGRAGRDGKPALCLLFRDFEATAAEFFMSQTYPPLEVIERVDRAITEEVGSDGEKPLSAGRVALLTKCPEPQVRSAMGWLDASGLISKRPSPKVYMIDVIKAPKERSGAQKEFLESLYGLGRRLAPPEGVKARFEIPTRKLDEHVEKWRGRLASCRKAGIVRAESPTGASLIKVYPHDFATGFDSGRLIGGKQRARARLEEMRGYLDVPAEKRADYLQRAVGLEKGRLAELLKRKDATATVTTVSVGPRRQAGPQLTAQQPLRQTTPDDADRTPDYTDLAASPVPGNPFGDPPSDFDDDLGLATASAVEHGDGYGRFVAQSHPAGTRAVAGSAESVCPPRTVRPTPSETVTKPSAEDDFDLGGCGSRGSATENDQSQPQVPAVLPNTLRGIAWNATEKLRLPKELSDLARLTELCVAVGLPEPSMTAGGLYMKTLCPSCRGRNDGESPVHFNKKGERLPDAKRDLGNTLTIAIHDGEGKPIDEDEWSGVCVCGHKGMVPAVLYRPVPVVVAAQDEEFFL